MSIKVNNAMIYGLNAGKDDWLIKQLKPIIESGENHVDGLSLAPKGVGQNGELIMEINGNLNPTQLRLLANAIENTPNNG